MGCYFSSKSRSLSALNPFPRELYPKKLCSCPHPASIAESTIQQAHQLLSELYSLEQELRSHYFPHQATPFVSTWFQDVDFIRNVLLRFSDCIDCNHEENFQHAIDGLVYTALVQYDRCYQSLSNNAVEYVKRPVDKTNTQTVITRHRELASDVLPRLKVFFGTSVPQLRKLLLQVLLIHVCDAGGRITKVHPSSFCYTQFQNGILLGILNMCAWDERKMAAFEVVRSKKQKGKSASSSSYKNDMPTEESEFCFSLQVDREQEGIHPEEDGEAMLALPMATVSEGEKNGGVYPQEKEKEEWKKISTLSLRKEQESIGATTTTWGGDYVKMLAPDPPAVQPSLAADASESDILRDIVFALMHRLRLVPEDQQRHQQMVNISQTSQALVKFCDARIIRALLGGEEEKEKIVSRQTLYRMIATILYFHGSNTMNAGFKTTSQHVPFTQMCFAVTQLFSQDAAAKAFLQSHEWLLPHHHFNKDEKKKAEDHNIFPQYSGNTTTTMHYSQEKSEHPIGVRLALSYLRVLLHDSGLASPINIASSDSNFSNLLRMHNFMPREYFQLLDRVLSLFPVTSYFFNEKFADVIEPWEKHHLRSKNHCDIQPHQQKNQFFLDLDNKSADGEMLLQMSPTLHATSFIELWTYILKEKKKNAPKFSNSRFFTIFKIFQHHITLDKFFLRKKFENGKAPLCRMNYDVRGVVFGFLYGDVGAPHNFFREKLKVNL